MDTLRLLKAGWSRAQENSAGLLAAGIAYYAFLSFVPLLAVAVLTYGLVATPETLAEHGAAIADTLPPSAAELVRSQLESIAETRGGASGFGLIAAIAISLFSARVAAGSIITAFNLAFDAPESRGFIKSNLLAVAITLGAVLAISLVVLVTALVAFVYPGSDGAFASFAGVALGALGAAVLAYRIVPNVDDVSFAEAVRGGVLFAVGWTAASLGFAYYTSNFANYNATYGSLGAIIVLLTWLYLSAYLLLLGAHFAAAARTG
jgi:membrane protein